MHNWSGPVVIGYICICCSIFFHKISSPKWAKAGMQVTQQEKGRGRKGCTITAGRQPANWAVGWYLCAVAWWGTGGAWWDNEGQVCREDTGGSGKLRDECRRIGGLAWERFPYLQLAIVYIIGQLKAVVWFGFVKIKILYRVNIELYSFDQCLMVHPYSYFFLPN